MRTYLNGGNARKALPADTDADDISSAVKLACSTEHSLKVLLECHRMFFHDDAFGLPLFGKYALYCTLYNLEL